MRREKQLLLDEIKEKIDQSNGFIMTRYQNLTANTASKFRSDLAANGSDFEVVRKRVFIKAAAGSDIPLEITELQGHIGVIFTSKDPIETTKMIFQFSQENENIVEVVGGRIEGRMYKAQDVEKLSKLPSMNEMRAQLLGLFEAPMAQTLAVVDALLTSVIHCLDNKASQTTGKN